VATPSGKGIKSAGKKHQAAENRHHGHKNDRAPFFLALISSNRSAKGDFHFGV
jgi:hypothetical protein